MQITEDNPAASERESYRASAEVSFRKVAELQSIFLQSTFCLAKGGFTPDEEGELIDNRNYAEKELILLGVEGSRLRDYKSYIRQYAMGNLEIDKLNQISRGVFHDLFTAQEVQWANEGVVGPLVVTPIKFAQTSEPIDHELGFRNVILDGIARKFIEECVLGWLIHHQILVFFRAGLPIICQKNEIKSLGNRIENLEEDVRKSATKLMDNGAFSIDIEDFEESVSRIARNTFLDSKGKRGEHCIDLTPLSDNLSEETSGRLLKQILVETGPRFVLEHIDSDLLIAAYDIELREAFDEYGGGSIGYSGINNPSVEKSRPESTTLQKNCEKDSEGTVVSRFLSRLQDAFLSMFRL